MIELREVNKFFGDAPAVLDFSLTVEEGEFCCLIGPSGCGKTTTLKMINRMIESTSGTIRVGGRGISDFRPHELRRSMGYVIQSVGLFPHMTVMENICVVPRLLKWDRARAESRARELLELFDMPPDTFKDNYPSELSGGQAQRTGVARALAGDPDILLMDEPFGALDPISRANLQQQFARIQSELRKTVVFVTHDVDEAVRLASRIVLMRDGRMVQTDYPERMLSIPGNAFVEQFLGSERSLKRLSRLRVSDAMRAFSRGAFGIDAVRQNPATGIAGIAVPDNPGPSWPQSDSLTAGKSDEPALDPGVDLRHALALLLQHRKERLTVRDGNGRVLGELNLHDLLGV
ncbi:MAG: ABC transporter ATP-binding protein [Desulfohalobiaceae bacterium]